jgi:signal transduction histidine kinase
MPNLRIIQGPDAGRDMVLPEGALTVGRLDCDLTLTDTTCSRRHTQFELRNGACILSDMGSTNGTYLNGVRISRPVQLQPGDNVRCGRTVMEYEAPVKPLRLSLEQPQQPEDAADFLAALAGAEPEDEQEDQAPKPGEADHSLRILYDVIADAVRALDADALLQRALDRVFEELQAERAFACLLDNEGQLTVAAQRLVEHAQMDPDEPLPRCIIDDVLARQSSVLLEDTASDEKFAGDPAIERMGLTSVLCSPLMGSGQAIGLIYADTTSDRRHLDEKHLKLVIAVASQAGMALENGRLLGEAITAERLSAVGETVAYLSHHIKNILQALGAGTDVVELALDAGNLDKARDAWPIVQRNLTRINQLILNMLAYSKQRQPKLSEADLTAILEDVVELVEPRAIERGIAVNRQLADLPPVPADPAGIHQAILNLLNNALDAVDDGTGVVRISSRYMPPDRRKDAVMSAANPDVELVEDAQPVDTRGKVVVEIGDNGSGIAASDRETIFTPFFSRKGQKGTGLGLAVAKKVIDEHEGTIELSSSVGVGTTFRITLPTAPVEDADLADTIIGLHN